MRIWTKTFSSLAMATVLALATSGVASAATDPGQDPIVASKAGITAVQIAPVGASASEIDQAIQSYQNRHSPRLSFRVLVANGTADYYSYCEEGTSGLMVWTNQHPTDCYGWYYEYLNGSRISKVNMLKLKATSGYPSNVSENKLQLWCNANFNLCILAQLVAPVAGKYLWGLLFTL